MSHIETGNTKLSLQVFVNIANALSVRTDELLYDDPQKNNSHMRQEITTILDSCSSYEMHIIIDIIKVLKSSLEKYKK